ncbi:MAG: hypothetical protein A4E28_00438 [Methanocella sp. PtaU1.Bin125]|nr:MAG: hypothetical protein A4E28_00438 [Methanocella sp. PtaU1.Bin125]
MISQNYGCLMMIKAVKCLALTALILVIVATSINCVQQGTVTPAAPSPSPSPSPEPLPAGNFTADEQINIYNIATSNPYVKERILQTAWRSQHEEGGRLAVNTSYTTGGVVYMRFHEIAPGVDRMRVLPAAIIVPGNPETAGINVIAFVNASESRVEYVGFVPRSGMPVNNATYTSTEYGLDERDPVWGLHQYNNVTIVDTGFVRGMSLTGAQIDQANVLAMTNETVRGYPGTHNAVMRNVTVHAYETGHPYRYVLAYPMVTIDVMDGDTRYDTVFVLADLKNNKVAGVEHGRSYLW